jgi:hypothetical protein
MNLQGFVDGVRVQARPDRGRRHFSQDWEDASVFWETTGGSERGTPFSAEEIDALSNDGWSCTIIEYAKDWRADDTPGHRIKLDW